MDNIHTKARQRAMGRKDGDNASRFLMSVVKNPVAFGVSAGLIILGFAAGAALSELTGGGEIAAEFFTSLKNVEGIDVLSGLIRSVLFNVALASAVIMMRVFAVAVPLSCLALAVKGAALGFAFDATHVCQGGFVMSVFAVLLPAIPTLTALSFMFSSGLGQTKKIPHSMSDNSFLRDAALFLLGVLCEGLCSQAIALFIDAAV